MALFRPYERNESAKTDRIQSLTPKGEKAAAKAAAKTAPTAPAAAPEAENPGTRAGIRKKQGATPSRKAAEAARMERLHPTLSPKEQRRADARARSAARMDSWSRIEQSPERQLLRDYVDTRWTVAEFMLPLMILLMALSMISIQAAPQISYYVTLALWPLMIMAIINVAIMWRGFKKLLAERHPGASTKGLLMYMMNRSIMLRRFRQPGPRIKRGDPI
ncbi:DUF3043 domain-containing protein [Tessaracoccus flavus]|uniref:Uncharacterized protein n=1 Tax=Tessaracoccus flavus TaxID=1610493 RepID=A0A1Q2CD13_9ACTN|nr:DUF3043 domain-containing protein [Tessaracoccus flavus]AQP44012.1 hypothetical protein RPIT_03610 [Tessaracoccus flavus]SDY32034.1 Protein of unknown function [Tessaracoccus flavus]